MISTVFHNATIVDGTGTAPYTTDIAIVDDRVALIGNLEERDARVRLDCSGLTLAPGFIDVHSHSDELWLALPGCDGKILQGVTTEIGGNCGTSAAPVGALAPQWRDMDEFLGLVERSGVAMNVATLVGLGTTRAAIAGYSNRRLSAEELTAQAQLVQESCEQGALGVSSGLIYTPSMYADTAELVALASAARRGGAPLYATHVRDEGDGVVDAIEEALRIGEQADVTVQCSHHKASGKNNWGKVHQTLALIDAARAGGAPVFCDVYPYVASWTQLATILPAWSRDGGVEATLERLNDPQMVAAIALHLRLKNEGLWHDMMITEVASEDRAHLAGMRVDDIAREWGVPPSSAVVKLLRDERLEVGAVFFKMNEDDVATVLGAPFCCIGSDASIRALEGPTARGVPHPRTFGTFPRVFRRFVHQRACLDVPQAVRRMTSLPAQIFNVRQRGTIAVGNFADIVVFDSMAIHDTATYEQPYQAPRGIHHVFVNGEAVLLHGTLTPARPGRVLRSCA